MNLSVTPSLFVCEFVCEVCRAHSCPRASQRSGLGILHLCGAGNLESSEGHKGIGEGSMLRVVVKGCSDTLTAG